MATISLAWLEPIARCRAKRHGLTSTEVFELDRLINQMASEGLTTSPEELAKTLKPFPVFLDLLEDFCDQEPVPA